MEMDDGAGTAGQPADGLSGFGKSSYLANHVGCQCAGSNSNHDVLSDYRRDGSNLRRNDVPRLYLREFA